MRSTIHEQLQTMETIGGIKFVDELVLLFIDECESRFAKLEFALPDDLPEAGRLFHQIQGSAASTGASRLRYICAVGEEACHEGNGEKVARCYQLGLRELQRVKPFFTHWKK